MRGARATRTCRAARPHDTEAIIERWLRRVLAADTVHFLAHRDVKMDNVLAQRTIDGTLHVKLGDRLRPRQAQQRRRAAAAARQRRHAGWAAPETIALERGVVDVVYGIKADIWSFGIALFEMISHAPYTNLSRFEIPQRTKQGERPKFATAQPSSDDIVRVFESATVVDPAARPTALTLEAQLRRLAEFGRL